MEKLNSYKVSGFMVQNEIQDQCPHSKLFPGFRACFILQAISMFVSANEIKIKASEFFLDE